MEGPGDVAEIDLILDLSVGAKSQEFRKETIDLRGQCGGGPGYVAEIELRLDLDIRFKK